MKRPRQEVCDSDIPLNEQAQSTIFFRSSGMYTEAEVWRCHGMNSESNSFPPYSQNLEPCDLYFFLSSSVIITS